MMLTTQPEKEADEMMARNRKRRPIVNSSLLHEVALNAIVLFGKENFAWNLRQGIGCCRNLASHTRTHTLHLNPRF